MAKSPNNIIKIAYNRRYKPVSDAPGASRLAGFEVYGKIIRERLWPADYKIEPLELGYLQIVTTAIQTKEHCELPVDFITPEQNKIKRDKVKVLEVILKE